MSRGGTDEGAAGANGLRRFVRCTTHAQRMHNPCTKKRVRIKSLMRVPGFCIPRGHGLRGVRLETNPMILYPAIDLKGGQCVRLLRGDMDRATVFGDDPAAQARAFASAGCRWLHVVDLDGAFAGRPVNGRRRSRRSSRRSPVPVQLGGGIRDRATIEGWLDKGVARVVLGTAALRDPELVRERRPRRIPAGSPSASTPATAGSRSRAGPRPPTRSPSTWPAASRTPASRRSSIPTSTATARWQGSNVEATAALAEAVTMPVIASGGVASMADMRALKAERRAARRRDLRPGALRGPARPRPRRSPTWRRLDAEGPRHPLPRRQGRAGGQGRELRRPRDAGDPVEQARAYDAAGADELCFLDISASHEGRGTLLDVAAAPPRSASCR